MTIMSIFNIVSLYSKSMLEYDWIPCFPFTVSRKFSVLLAEVFALEDVPELEESWELTVTSSSVIVAFDR